MTREETLQVLAILKAAYPASYNGMTKREAEGTVTVWNLQFSSVPVGIVMMAVQKLISTNKFPPAISEVKAKISSLHWEAYEMISTSIADVLSEQDKGRYRQIYEATKGYKTTGGAEPSLSQMLSNNPLLQISE